MRKCINISVSHKGFVLMGHEYDDDEMMHDEFMISQSISLSVSCMNEFHDEVSVRVCHEKSCVFTSPGG